MDINDLREEIDEIDSKLIHLFEKRMSAVAKISELKKKNDLPVLQEGREQEILNRISCLARDDISVYARELYKTIFSISRSYQKELNK